MARPVSIELHGGRKLRRALKDADKALTDGLKDLHRRIAGTVASAAAPPRLTGRLAGSIRAAGTKASAVVRAGYASIPYAGVIEWGWPGHGIEAQPYIVPAAHGTEPIWTGMYLSEVQGILDRAAGEADGSGD